MPLPRSQRIRRSSEFAPVREKGASWSSRYLILATLPLAGEPQSRFGFTVTRRVGNAVARNLLRRRLSAIIAAQAPAVTVPYLVVTIPRHGAAGAEYSTLEREWIKLARRARLLPPAPL